MARNAIKSEFRTSKMADRSEMARNSIESDFRTSKMAAKKIHSVSIWNGQNCYRKWISDIQNCRSIWNGQKCNQKWFSNILNVRQRPFCKTFKKIILYWSVLKKIKKKVEYRSEMARNKIESEFRTSKMGAAGHFVKKIKQKFRIDLKRPEILSKVTFGHPKWPTAAILSKKFKTIKIAYRSELARNAIKGEFRTFKVSAGGHLVKK